ncbi:MAG: glycerol-3-phosphate 1-O-acyltransferase PlsY [Clostridiales Family XIII bacterium]|jgi:glycerol-3-phosphate acyltransferase PlsY|nr:glycerol-3-phosphate 1-O-acyltransferase PlsY [Clostridiales Family XIII bacterium]
MIENFGALRYEITHIDANHMLLTGCVLLAYFAGTVSPSILLGKLYGVDVRNTGSGNAGTTNVLRVIGKKAAVITLAVDIFKGFIVVALAKPFGGGAFALLCGFAVLCGHIWPLFYDLKGGKGVATALGVILAFDPKMGLMLLCIALALIALTQRVSVGALVAAAAFPVFMHNMHPPYFVPALLIALLLWLKHRQNIRRIIRGEEPKLNFRSGAGKKTERETQAK